jgi:hypothetical protein
MAVDLDNAYTNLTLTGLGVAPYATRGLTMDLAPLSQAGQIVRNCNGGIMDLSDPLFRKYRVTISCQDQRAPPFGGLWPGQLVTLESPIEMGNGELSSDRSGTSVDTDGGIAYFRPTLDCVVLDFSQSGQEYAVSVSWTLVLEEV